MKKTKGGFKFAQTCSSRQCRKEFKDQLNDLSDAVTTPHEYFRDTRTVKCMYCGKTTKLGK